MLCVLEDSGQRICEYRNCLSKRSTMFCLICFRFSGIPFKLKGHLVEMVSRLFVKSLLLPSGKQPFAALTQPNHFTSQNPLENTVKFPVLEECSAGSIRPLMLRTWRA